MDEREWLPEDWRRYWLANAKRGRCDLTDGQKRLYRMLILRYTNAAGDGVYGCRNFDPETRDCRIYETRPPMCRRYPAKPCKYEHCTKGC